MNVRQAWHSVFRNLNPKKVAAYELAEAELEVLEAQTGLEYSAAMVRYHETRIKRLRAYLAAG